MVPLCKYILDGDQPCGQAAIQGGHYCRHHQVVRKSVAAADEAAHPPLPFIYPSNYSAQLYNYFLLAQALNEGRLDLRTVNALTRLLKACDASLKAALEVAQFSGPNLSSQPDTEPEMEEIADQDEAAADHETMKIAAAGEPEPVRTGPSSEPAPPKMSTLELLRRQRGGKRHKRRR